MGGANNREKRFSPKLCDWENCSEVNRKIENLRTSKQVYGLGGLNSILSTELEVQVETPTC